MSRIRRIATHRRDDSRRHRGSEDGMSLIEVLVALSLLVVVMLTTAGFFVSSLKQTSGAAQSQEAAALANQTLEYTRSVPAKQLLAGRTATAVNAATASPGIADLSQDVLNAYNYDGWDGSATSASAPVPIVQNWTISGTQYAVTTFIDRCYVVYGANQQCNTTVSPHWLYRITASVTWKLEGGRSCQSTATGVCQYVASTLRDPGNDQCFNVNINFAGCSVSQPSITTVAPSTVTTNSTTLVTLTGVNFDPGARVSIDNGGTVSNVLVVNSTTITFNLVTNNTPAAVGTSTIRVTNLNGKFALGTLTITSSTPNVTSVTPATGGYGSTLTYVINGTGFDPAAVVTMDSAAVAGTVTWNSATKMTVVLTSYPAKGSHTFTLTNPDGGADTGTFSITTGAITFTSITPSTASFGYGSTKSFALNGTGFVNGATVKMDGAAIVGTVTWNSATKMTVLFTNYPAVGSHTFLITNPDSGSASLGFTITTGAVNISSITTSTGSFVYGSTKTFFLNGTGFVSGATVKMDSAAIVGTVTYNSATKMTVVFTNNPAVGAHSFTLTNPDTGSDTEPFTITTATVGTITSITPTTATAGGTNVTFTVTGTGFVTGAGTITLNGPPTGNTDYTLNMTVSSSTRATFVVPALPGAGTNAINATLNYSSGTVSPTFVWTLTTR